MIDATNKDVINFVRNNSYLQKQCSDEKDLQFTTRRHTFGGRCGDEDIDEANRMVKVLNNSFDNVSAEISTCDEWVSIMVEIISNSLT
jgi:hypothetical protein